MNGLIWASGGVAGPSEAGESFEDGCRRVGTAEGLASICTVACFVFDEREEPGEGFVLASEGDGGEEGGTEPMVGCGFVACFEGCEGFGCAGFGDSDGGFGGCIVLRRQELCGPGDGARTFEPQDAGVASSEEFWVLAREFGAEAEEKHRGVGAHLFDGAGGVELDGEFLISEEWSEMGKEVRAVESAALNEGESAGSAKRSGSVGAAAPDGFELSVPSSQEKEFMLLIFEGRESLGESVFGPALWIGLVRVFVREEAMECSCEVGDECGQVQVRGELCGFGDEEVITLLEGFAKGRLSDADWCFAKGIECSSLGFYVGFAWRRHGWLGFCWRGSYEHLKDVCGFGTRWRDFERLLRGNGHYFAEVKCRLLAVGGDDGGRDRDDDGGH
jgi:hypothetical protein